MNKKQLIIVLSVLALIGLAVYAYVMHQRRKQNETGPTATNTGPATAGIDVPPFPLKIGSRGNEVTQLQKYLLKEYGAKVSVSGAIDGIWGDITDAAVKKFLMRDNVSQAIYTKFRMAEY